MSIRNLDYSPLQAKSIRKCSIRCWAGKIDMLSFTRLGHGLALRSSRDLLVLMINILLRSAFANGIGVAGDNNRGIGSVVSIDVLKSAVGCKQRLVRECIYVLRKYLPVSG